MGKSGLSLTFPKYTINQAAFAPCVARRSCLGGKCKASRLKNHFVHIVNPRTGREGPYEE